MALSRANVFPILQLTIFIGHYFVPVTNHVPKCSLSFNKTGDITLGGIFSFYTNPLSPCEISGLGNHINLRGVFQAEAMRFAIEEINNRTNLLPHVTLGFNIVDDGWSENVALGHTLDLMKDRICLQSSNRNALLPRRVGIVGLSRSATTIPAARLAELYEVPVISYLASSEELADKSQFPYFLRTVPPDGLQVGAIVDLLKYYQWIYIGLIHSIDSYGIHGARQLQLQFQAREICVAFVASVSDSTTEKELGEVTEKLTKFPQAKTIVMFSSGKIANIVLAQVKKMRLTREITWVGADDWGFDEDLLNQGFQKIVKGGLFTRFFSISIPKFEQYMKDLNPSQISPWICAYLMQNTSSANCSDTRDLKSIISANFSASYSTLPVIDAVYVYAHGLHSLLDEKCGDNGTCQHNFIQDINGTELYYHLQKVNFTGIAGRFQFDEDSNPPGKYILRNWQLLDGKYQSVDIGLWESFTNSSTKLTIDESKIQFPNESLFPSSICKEDCRPGYRTVPSEKKCCSRCERCSKNFIVVNDTECVECSLTMWPNINYTNCKPIVPTNIDLSQPIIPTMIFFACFGIILTSLAIVAMVRYREYRLIKATSRELSAINFAGISLSFVCSFILIQPTTISTCIAVDALISVSFTLTYASILLKVNRIYRVFNAAKTLQKPRMVAPRDQLIIVAVIVCVQVVIIIIGSFVAPTERVILVPNRSKKYAEYYCQFRYGFLAGCIYNAILVLFCCYYAFRTRHVPDNYNESKFIGISVYSNLVVCLSAVPVYSVANSAVYKVAVIGFALLINAYLHILCVYVPKIYAVKFGSVEEKTHPQSLSSQHKSGVLKQEGGHVAKNLVVSSSDCTQKQSSVA